jgi:hypothetical protein
MLKLVSLRLERNRPSRRSLFEGVAWQKVLQHFTGNVNGVNLASSSAKYTVLPSFVIVGKLMQQL